MGTAHLILAALLGVHFAAAQRAPSGPDGGGAQPNIINGTDAKEGQFPFMIRINYTDSEGPSEHYCGGALLRENVVITAAHCVIEDGKRIPLKNFKVIAEAQGETKSIVQHPLRIIVHEDYRVDPTSGIPSNDLALISLENKIPFEPINIASSSSPYTVGTAVTVIGWGLINTDGEYAVKLQELQSKISKEEDCFKYWKEKMGDDITKIIDVGMFCTKGYGTSAPGDSGGPVFETTKVGEKNKYELVGVVSWGDDNSKSFTFNMNVDVYHYRDWISSTIDRIDEDSFWPGIVGDRGSNGPVIIYSKDGEGTICNGGVNEDDIMVMCQELGYKMGMRASCKPSECKDLPPFGYSSMSCTEDKWTSCSFVVYPGGFPCFQGDQLAVKCYDEAWDFEVTDMMARMIPLKGTESRRGRMIVYVEAKKYGIDLDMKDQVQVSLAIAKDGGLVPLKADMKYKRKKEYYIGKFKKDDEINEDTCFYAIAWVRCTMFYTVGEYGPDDCPSVDNLRDNIENWIKAMNDSNCKED